MTSHLVTTLLVTATLSTSLLAQATAPATRPAAPRIISEARPLESPNGTDVLDFSYAGYKAGLEPIPNLPIVLTVTPVPGDNTARLQQALDYVASLPENQRGAILLAPGTYDIAGKLTLRSSNTALRGSGPTHTILRATGTDRRTLISLQGPAQRQPASPIPLTAAATLGTRTLTLADASKLKAGDTLLVHRRSTQAWIATLNVPGDTAARWTPGDLDIRWDRTITAINGNTITLDAPLTHDLDLASTPTVIPYTWPNRLNNAGIENLALTSTYDDANPKDENHAWYGLALHNAKDAWVRNVAFTHFAGSAVWVYETCKQVTVRDCVSRTPISELANTRRQTFKTGGTQTLFLHCQAEEGLHDFTADKAAPGPNAFVQCDAVNALDASGPIDSYATGLLYDNFRTDHSLALTNLGRLHGFTGWNAANSMVYQSQAGLFRVASPPGATNWANSNWGTFDGNGSIKGTGDFASDDSLYTLQLSKRLGAGGMDKALQLTDWMDIPHDSYTNPPLDKAAKAIAASTQPALTIADWVASLEKRSSIPTEAPGAKSLNDLPKLSAFASATKIWRLKLQEGKLIANGQLLGGALMGTKYWRGSPDAENRANNDFTVLQTSLVRFVPGRDQLLLTDPLPELQSTLLQQKNVRLQEHHYALWYDRRNDDHERVKRIDGDALPPFYDLPFARSGKDTAWDGLSKYDLTKYNDWYFKRLRQYADLGEQNGVVLLHNHFFQHNILEAGAHWASSPWRTANNINSTGFPEPPPYAGDKRIFMAEQFYDVTNPTRTALYKAYIRHILDVHADQSNVLHLTSGEFSGPLHFVQFWLDTIGQWEKDTGKHALVGLAAPKDVQDAILADPERAKIVDAIVIRYWWYTDAQDPYAPPGGKNLSPRQFLRLKGSSPTFNGAYRAVAEYRQKFPDKAVIFSPENGDHFPLAAILAGGSLPNLPQPLPEPVSKALATMKPAPDSTPELIHLQTADNHHLFYSKSKNAALPIPPDLRSTPINGTNGTLIYARPQ